MHVARYLGQSKRKSGRSKILTVGAYYQIEYSHDRDMVDVLIHPLLRADDEWWEGHIEYRTLQDAFDDWDDICEEVRSLEPFRVKMSKALDKGEDHGQSEDPSD